MGDFLLRVRPITRISNIDFNRPFQLVASVISLATSFSFHCKTHRALILLLLTSKPDPLSLGSDLGPPLRGGFVYPSEQSPRCFGIFLCPGQKRHHPPAPLLPLPNCDPLCWARSWQTALRGSLSCPFSESFGWRVYQQPRGPEWTHVLSGPRGCLRME